MQASANPSATSSGMKIQPGIEVVPTGLTVTCDQPKAPPTTSRSQRTKVLAKVPFADIVAVPCTTVAGGGTSPVPVPAGAAQPGSSSSAVWVNRFSLSTGLAIALAPGVQVRRS